MQTTDNQPNYQLRTYFSLVEIFVFALRDAHYSFVWVSLFFFAVLFVSFCQLIFIAIISISCTYNFQYRDSDINEYVRLCSRMHIAHGSSRNEKFSATQYGNIAPEDFRTAHLRRGVCTFFVGFLVQNVCVHQLKIHSIIWLTIWNLFYVLLVCATRKICNLFRWKFSFCIILQR